MAVVVSGGTRGIGLEIAGCLARSGETVVMGYRRDRVVAQAAVARLSAAGVRALAVAADIATPEGAATLVGAVPAGEPIRQLVHCAVEVVPGPALTADPAVFRHAVDANGMGLYHLVRAAQESLERGSTVLFVSSRGARVVVPADYTAVGIGKAAGEAIVRYLAVELAPRGVQVHTVSPGAFDTAAIRTLYGDRTQEILAQKAAAIPAGRALRHEDYLAVIRFLTSPEAAMVTGLVVPVYGGADLLG
jgi:NAD(P)-dependent dehydrogenase (short-subunit alcohol dehydrogenase family)